MKQKTLVNSAKIAGKGLHYGEDVSVVLRPSGEGSGILFRRRDMSESSDLLAVVKNSNEAIRCTSLANEFFKISTVEHLLSALYGLGITNAIIELDGPELPILDGSAKPWVNLIKEAGIAQQDENAQTIEITEPISVVEGDRSIIALPYDGFRVTCTSADARGIHTQHLSLEIEPDVYANDIAPARTFTVYEDIEPLIKLGKIKGGSLDCAVVLKGDKFLSKEPLRFADEFVRHKILDIIGDLSLLGKPIKGHIIAVKTGHALNAKLAKAIAEQVERENSTPDIASQKFAMNIVDILQTIPHRYPFVLVDRVLSIDGDKLTAVKNVTFNEPYFCGHFPENPVMPGVLQLEAMAQAAGILMGTQLQNNDKKTTFFMSADKVKFRQVVQPGDQLIIEATLTKIKNNKIGTAECLCKVNNQIVSSAELMFMILNAK